MVSPQTILVHQTPDHVLQVGEVRTVAGDPYVITDIKPKFEEGMFPDWNGALEYNWVVITVERVTEAKAA